MSIPKLWTVYFVHSAVVLCEKTKYLKYMWNHWTTTCHVS